jgi:hypothetical protein
MPAIWVRAHLPPRAVGTPRVQGVGDLAQAPPLGPERLDQRQDVGGKPVRRSLQALGAFAAHLIETAPRRSSRRSDAKG